LKVKRGTPLVLRFEFLIENAYNKLEKIIDISDGR